MDDALPSAQQEVNFPTTLPPDQKEQIRKSTEREILCEQCEDQMCSMLCDLALSQSKFPPSLVDELVDDFDGRIKLTRKGQTVEGWAKAGCPLAQFLIAMVGDADDIWGSKLTISVSDEKHRASPLRGDLHVADFKIESVSSGKKETTPVEFSAEIFTDHGDPVSSVVLGRPVSNDFGSDACIQLAHQWILSCTEGDHRSCPPAKESELPSRLLTLEPDNASSMGTVRLHVTSAGERGHYVALSYCWGHQQTFILKSFNFKSMVHSIPLENLPKTIRDAIYLTKALGFRYIWIDALCIIQDSDNDKVEQVSKMQDIFRNSMITISAERAADCQDGFLGRLKSDTELKPEMTSKRIPYRSSEGYIGSIQLRELVKNQRNVQPIHRRGWTYQENFLSRRVISFGDQIRWRCTSGEDLNVGILAEDPHFLNPLHMVSFDQNFMEDYIWHLVFRSLGLAAKFIGTKRRAIRRNKASRSSTTETESDSEDSDSRTMDTENSDGDPDSNTMDTESSDDDSDFFGRYLVEDHILGSWIKDRKTWTSIRTAFERNDLRALIQALGPGMVRIFQLYVDASVLDIIDNRLRDRIKTAIIESDGVEFVQSIAPIIARIVQAVYQSPSGLKPIFKDKDTRQALWAALERKDGLAISEALVRLAGKIFPGFVRDFLIEDGALGETFEDGEIVAAVQEKEGLGSISAQVSAMAQMLALKMSREKAELHWTNVVEEFSGRLLTNPNDRLPAFSGIAYEFSRYFNGRYLAGLWENNILKNLMWYQENTVTSVPSPVTAEPGERHSRAEFRPYIAPSWSWASAHGKVKYVGTQEIPPPVTEFCGCDMFLASDGNVFGEVRQAILKLRGPLTKVDKTWFFHTWLSRKTIYPDANSQLASIISFGLNSLDYTMHYFWVLQLFHEKNFFQSVSYGLILSEVKPTVFKRVGYYEQVYAGISYSIGLSKIERWEKEYSFEVGEIKII